MSLGTFVAYLAEKGLLDISDLPDGYDIRHDEFHEGWYDALDMTEAYVFIARMYGADMGYRINDDVTSVGSDDLISDFEKLHFSDLPPAEIPEGIREAEYLDLVSGRGYMWLSIAGSKLVMSVRWPDINIVNEPVPIGNRPEDTAELVASVHAELEKRGLFEKVKQILDPMCA